MIEIFIGVVSGIIGGLGMGGGTILILLLSLFFGVEQHVAQSTNVIFFIPTAIASIIVNLRNKNINLKQGLPICLWGIVGAFLVQHIYENAGTRIKKMVWTIFNFNSILSNA